MDATTGALIVAALSVVMSPITAWLTFRWGRDQERERLASERAADEARWQREERTRRVVRGEEAAGRLLELVDEATANLNDQAAMHSTYIEMRRRAELLTDDATRDRLFQVADALYYGHQARQAEPRLTNQYIGSTAADAAHAVIRAYLHERPLPDLSRFDRLRALKDKGGEMIFEELGMDEDLDDPLADPPDENDAR